MPSISRNTLEAICMAGQKMSNILYNLKQSDKQEPRNRQMMGECQQEWDDVMVMLREEFRQRTSRRKPDAEREAKYTESAA